MRLKRRRSLANAPQPETNATQDMEQESDLIAVSQLAKKLGVSERTLWRLLAKRALIEPIRLGGSTRWRRREVEDWIAQGCPALVTSDN